MRKEKFLSKHHQLQASRRLSLEHRKRLVFPLTKPVTAGVTQIGGQAERPPVTGGSPSTESTASSPRAHKARRRGASVPSRLYTLGGPVAQRPEATENVGAPRFPVCWPPVTPSSHSLSVHMSDDRTSFRTAPEAYERARPCASGCVDAEPGAALPTPRAARALRPPAALGPTRIAGTLFQAPSFSPRVPGVGIHLLTPSAMNSHLTFTNV